ncbi:MAG: SPOR domain-containing protein [Bacteroidetes bacterium]|nr:SPOR domain-containing protein [Bacteroidota bacterium]
MLTEKQPREKSRSTEGSCVKFSWLFLFFILSLSTSVWGQKPAYTEDLSSLRPKVTAEVGSKKDTIKNKIEVVRTTPRYTVNAKVDQVLDSIDRFNLTRRFVDGYTIQIYSGQKKEDALSASKKLMDAYADLKSNIQYQQPKFKVTVGKYFTRLEAQKDFLRLKRLFSSTILVPERIMIK